MIREERMDEGRLFKIALLGSAGVDEQSPNGKKAFLIGQLVAERQGILLTGGCTGLPHAAVLGAHSRDGMTVAVSPAMNRTEHRTRHGYPVDSRIIMFTGMGTKGRNVVLVRSADACIFAGGGMGTLNEFTIAFDELAAGCCIGILSHSDGLSDEFVKLAQGVTRPSAAALIEEQDPRLLMERVFQHLVAAQSEPSAPLP
jgi:uncharacterized protein (TIGR00725 family)